MRTPHSRSIVFLLSLLVVIPAFACAPADDAADDAADDTVAADATASADADWLDDLVASYEQHFNANHADSVAAMYTDDAVVLGADGTVANGRDEIRAWSAANQAGGAQLDVELIDRKVFGDQAVAIGSWEVTPASDNGEAAPVSGHWMGAYRATPDGWRSMGLISNYEQEMPPEALQGALPSSPPPDESTIDELLAAYQGAWNEGNVQGVADLYAEDAWAALINLPPVRGRAAIAEVMAERVPGTTIELQGARTVEFGDGWSGDGGLVRIRQDDGGEIVGHYWVLLHRGEDGAQSIHWALANGRPASVIPSGDGM